MSCLRFTLPVRRVAASIFFLILLTMAPIDATLAQPPTPGAVQESLRPRSVQPGMDRSVPAVTVPAPPRPAPPAGERRIRINRFAISGNTVFSESELRSLIADREGTDLTLADIYGVGDKLTDFYQSKGYSLTTVTVPAQRMQNGVLRLEVVEGKIGQLVFEGNKRYGDELLTRHLDPLAPGTILRFAELEREILLLNDLPGLIARSVLMPGKEYGTTDINLRMEETPVTATAVVDNQGRKLVGQWRIGADFAINNPFKYGDVLGLGYTHSQHNLLRQGRFSYGFPIFWDGSRVNVSYSRADYDVGGEFSALDITGISETARLQVTHPFIRSRLANLAWTVGGAYVRGQSDMLSIPLSDDTINFLETGLNYSRRNTSGGLATLSGLLATNFRNNPDGTSNDSLPPRLELHGDYEYLFRQGWSGVVRGEAVLSSDPLPDSNKYSLGGSNSVRGFVSSRLRGDKGAMGTLEFRRYIALGRANLMLRGFMDAGELSYDQALADGSSSDTLASAGAGMTVSLAGKYSLDLQWAKPIDGKSPGDGLNAPLWLTFIAMY